MKLVKGLVWAALSGAILTGCPKPMEVSEDGGAADAEVDGGRNRGGRQDAGASWVREGKLGPPAGVPGPGDI